MNSSAARNSARPFRLLPALAAAACFAVLGLASCARPDEEPAAEAEAAAEATPSSLPTGGDYHSTVIRAKGRTDAKLEDIQQIRQQQVQDEQDFHKK